MSSVVIPLAFMAISHLERVDRKLARVFLVNHPSHMIDSLGLQPDSRAMRHQQVKI